MAIHASGRYLSVFADEAIKITSGMTLAPAYQKLSIDQIHQRLWAGADQGRSYGRQRFSTSRRDQNKEEGKRAWKQPHILIDNLPYQIINKPEHRRSGDLFAPKGESSGRAAHSPPAVCGLAACWSRHSAA